jgi:flavin-dependent dehydrogenase
MAARFDPYCRTEIGRAVVPSAITTNSRGIAVDHPLHDYIVLGSGPAGLQLGYYLESARRNYLVLEAGQGPGTFFRTFPRHRQLISINKRYTGQHDPEVAMRMDWNSLLSAHERLLFTHWSERYFPQADEMVRYLESFASTCGIKVRYGVRLVGVKINGGGNPSGPSCVSNTIGEGDNTVLGEGGGELAESIGG